MGKYRSFGIPRMVNLNDNPPGEGMDTGIGSSGLPVTKVSPRTTSAMGMSGLPVMKGAPSSNEFGGPASASRPYEGGESRSDHFNAAADSALNDRFNQVIRNRVQDQQNLTFPEPPGDD